MAMATFKCETCNKKFFKKIEKENKCSVCNSALQRVFKTSFHYINENDTRDEDIALHNLYNFSDGQ